MITLPFPPSANRYWRTTARGGKVRTYISAEACDYKGEAWFQATTQKMRPIQGPVSIRMVFYFPNKRGDLDNRIKVLVDSLQGTAYVNDRQVHHLEATRCIDKGNPRVEVTVEAWDG